ncbi:MAG: VacJ family lipoprotein, partial [Pseudomonadota bacterium]
MKRSFLFFLLFASWIMIPSVLYGIPSDRELTVDQGILETVVDQRMAQSGSDSGNRYGHGIVIAGLEKKNEPLEEEPIEDVIADPLEPLNRAFFHFNDKLYFWLLKPLATGYETVVPQPLRVSVRNFFYNLVFPVRFLNCLLQGKFQGAEIEFVRFIANSTAGFAGFVDVVPYSPTLKEYRRYEEDLGQTLGVYGMGPGFYINWPILGPSTLRDTFGFMGDAFLEPMNYMVPRTKYNISVKAYETVNKTSLTLGEYEDLKRAAIDPYVSLR